MVLVGSYTCRTPAWLILHVHACNASAVEAVFQFVYPTTTQHGAFWVSGQFGATRALKLAPTTAWLTPAPPRVVPVGLLGIISDEGRRFKGEAAIWVASAQRKWPMGQVEPWMKKPYSKKK